MLLVFFFFLNPCLFLPSSFILFLLFSDDFLLFPIFFINSVLSGFFFSLFLLTLLFLLLSFLFLEFLLLQLKPSSRLLFLLSFDCFYSVFLGLFFVLYCLEAFFFFSFEFLLLSEFGLSFGFDTGLLFFLFLFFELLSLILGNLGCCCICIFLDGLFGRTCQVHYRWSSWPKAGNTTAPKRCCWLLCLDGLLLHRSWLRFLFLGCPLLLGLFQWHFFKWYFFHFLHRCFHLLGLIFAWLGLFRIDLFFLFLGATSWIWIEIRVSGDLIVSVFSWLLVFRRIWAILKLEGIKLYQVLLFGVDVNQSNTFRLWFLLICNVFLFWHRRIVLNLWFLMLNRFIYYLILNNWCLFHFFLSMLLVLARSISKYIFNWCFFFVFFVSLILYCRWWLLSFLRLISQDIKWRGGRVFHIFLLLFIFDGFFWRYAHVLYDWCCFHSFFNFLFLFLNLLLILHLLRVFSGLSKIKQIFILLEIHWHLLWRWCFLVLNVFLKDFVDILFMCDLFFHCRFLLYHNLLVLIFSQMLLQFFK